MAITGIVGVTNRLIRKHLMITKKAFNVVEIYKVFLVRNKQIQMEPVGILFLSRNLR